MAKADEITVELLAISSRADALMSELASVLSERRNLARTLRETGCVSSELMNRFYARGPIDRAMRIAGLLDFCGSPAAPGRTQLFDNDDGIATGRIPTPPFNRGPATETLAQALPQMQAETTASEETVP